MKRLDRVKSILKGLNLVSSHGQVVTVVSVEEWLTCSSPGLWSDDSQELDPDQDSQARFQQKHVSKHIDALNK